MTGPVHDGPPDSPQSDPQSSPTGGPRPARDPTLGDFFWIGTGVAVSVVGGGAIGYGLDTWFHTTPWLSFAGLAFGIVSAVLLCIAQLRKFV